MIVLGALVLDDDGAAVADVLEETVVRGLELRACGVGADAEDDGVEAGEIAGGDILRGEEGDVDAEVLEGLRHFIAGSGDVGDLEAWGDLNIGPGGLETGFAIGGIGADAGVSGGDEALSELLTVVVGDGSDGVGLGLDTLGRDVEADVLFVSVAGYGEGSSLRFGGPACREA